MSTKLLQVSLAWLPSESMRYLIPRARKRKARDDPLSRASPTTCKALRPTTGQSSQKFLKRSGDSSAPKEREHALPPRGRLCPDRAVFRGHVPHRPILRSPITPRFTQGLACYNRRRPRVSFLWVSRRELGAGTRYSSAAIPGGLATAQASRTCATISATLPPFQMRDRNLPKNS